MCCIFFSIVNDSCYVAKYYLNRLFFSLLSQNDLTSIMIADRLQKRIKPSFPVSVVPTFRDWILEQIFQFRAQGALFSNLFFWELNNANRVKKCAWSLKLEKSKKCALSSEPNSFMRIIKSKKLRLEFKIHIVQFQTPGDEYF